MPTIAPLQHNALPADLPARFGFRSGERGTHASRSIMLADLTQLLASTPADATHVAYRAAILEENALGKSTASPRLWSWKKLRELYGLDPRLAVFRCFRQLWEVDSAGRPLLALLCASARDPLLRMSAAVVLQAPIGSTVSSGDFAQAITPAAPDRFSPKTLEAMGIRLAASWTQSGHLAGGKTRQRAHPVLPGSDGLCSRARPARRRTRTDPRLDLLDGAPRCASRDALRAGRRGLPARENRLASRRLGSRCRIPETSDPRGRGGSS